MCCLWSFFDQISGRVCYIRGEPGWEWRWPPIKRRQRFRVLCPHLQATPLQAHEAKQEVTKENSQEKILWRWWRWRFRGEFKQRIWWVEEIFNVFITQEGKSRSLCLLAQLTWTCWLALVKSDVISAVQQLATCCAVNILQEAGIELWVLAFSVLTY